MTDENPETGTEHPLDRAAPPNLVATRIGLHRLAAYVIAPARYVATGRFGLRATPGGFGTPPFDGRQIRVEGATLIDENGDDTRSAPITTLRAAAEFLGSEIDPETAAEHDSPAVGDIDEDLAIDADASSFLGEYFSMAFDALEIVAAESDSVDPSERQLWPGHFDAAVDIGDEDRRATFGASPGDDSIDEPYIYTSVWWPDKIGLERSDPFWNSKSFVGSMRKLSEFPDGSPVEFAAKFWSDSRKRQG